MMELSTLSGQTAHYSAVRARLFNHKPLPVLITRPKALPEPVEVAPAPVPEPVEFVADGAPLNMLVQPSWRFLVAFAALKWGVDAKAVLGPSRKHPIMEARHEAISLIYSHQVRSLDAIGRMMGRHHSSILNSIRVSKTQPMAREKPLPLPVKPLVIEEAQPVLSGRSIEEVEEENRQLRELIGATPEFEFVMQCQHVLGLTNSCAKLLSILLRGRVRSHEGIWMAYCGPSHERPTLRVISALIVPIRKALRPYGVEVKTVWGEGFVMTKEDRARVWEILGLEAAAQ